MSKSWKFILPVVIVLTFALAFCFVQPVFAQDELPPTETPLEETVTETPVEEATAETPLESPTDLPPEEPAIAEEPVEPPAEGEPAEEAPAEIVLLDETGEPLSMASQEASEIMGGDPYFLSGGVYWGFSTTGVCPAIVPPGNCTMSATPIQAAINDFDLRGASGAIYVEAGTYTETLININGVPGLTGIFGAGADATTGSILNNINAQFRIMNQAASFTLSGFHIPGASYAGAVVDASNNTGTLTLDNLYIRNANAASGDGINITGQNGAVIVRDVQVDRCGNRGATIQATGNVSITNSSFDGSAGDYNLSVTSTNGNITLTGVSASNNQTGDGVQLRSKTGITIRNSVFNNNYQGTHGDYIGTGVFVFDDNRGNILIENSNANDNMEWGFRLRTLAGTVTLKNIQANENRWGVEIDTCQYVGSACTGSGAVTLTNAIMNDNYFDATFTGYNLSIEANGAITLTSVDARYSTHGYGAWIRNHRGASASAVSITHGRFNNNQGVYGGLRVESRGAVTLNHINADYNNYAGVNARGIFIQNDYGTGGVSILSTLGSNTAYYNGDRGVQIISKGAVLVNSLEAHHNPQANLDINNATGTGAVTLNNGVFYSSTSGPGVEIHSRGAISLTNVNAYSNNNSMNAWLDNSTSTGRAGVIVKDSQFEYCNITSLYINTTGAVTLTNIWGTHAPAGNGIWINATGTGAVSITGGTFSQNGANGILIDAGGAVTLKDIVIRMNSGSGIAVHNNTPPSGTPAITMTNIDIEQSLGYAVEVNSLGLITMNDFEIDNHLGAGIVVLMQTLGGVTINGNNASGHIWGGPGNNLQITANGTVLIKNLDASSSTNGFGLWLDASGGTGTVTISNSNFNSNFMNGAQINAKGTITLTGVNATYNGSYGLYLDNTAGTGGITINGTAISARSYFQNNKDWGIYANTHGAVTMTNLYLSANDNSPTNTTGGGILIPSASTGNVTMTNIFASSHNVNQAISISSLGTVTLTNLSLYNSYRGQNLLIDNTYATTPRNVSITGLISVNPASISGTGDGVRINSDGAISIRNFTISTNIPNGRGMYLVNTTGSGGVTLSGTSSLWSYIGYFVGLQGIYIRTNGPVSLSYINVNTAHAYGIDIDNTTGIGAVTLSNVTSNYNWQTGINILTSGSVSFTNVTADGNGNTPLGWGVEINNSTGTGTVTINKGTYTSNHDGGLRVLSNRAISVSNITSNYNGGGATAYGAYLSNSSGTGGISVLGTSSAPNDMDTNLTTGLYLRTNGDITIQYLTTSSSSLDNVDLDNSTGTGKVTISNMSSVNAGGFGVDISSRGAVYLTNISGQYNSLGGVRVANSGAPTPALVNINGMTEYNNYSVGLGITTNGNVTLNNVVNTSNSSTGAIITYASSLTATTSVTRSTFSSNAHGGLHVFGGGNITLNTITANSNTNSTDGYGVWLQNWNAGSVGTVQVLASYGVNNFQNNALHGAYIRTNGAVTLNNIYAFNNQRNGLYVDNHLGTGTVTLTGGEISYNYYHGIEINTNNTATLSNLLVYSNGFGMDYHGISLVTNGHTAAVRNSSVTGNAKYGIYANLNAALTVYKCNYFGNNRSNPNDLDPNIYLFGTTTLILTR